MKEVWRPVPGYEGRYEVSTLGRVKSLVSHRGSPRSQPKILKRILNSSGYLDVNLSSVERVINKVRIHRLVLMAFVGKPRAKQQGAHLNGIRTDARLSNLAWVSCKENHSHRYAHGTDYRGAKHPKSKLTERDVRKIRALRAAGKLTLHQIAAMFGLHNSTVSAIEHRHSWKHI